MTPEEKKAFLEMTGLSQEDLAPEKPEPKTFTKEDFTKAFSQTMQDIMHDKNFNEETKLATSLTSLLVCAKMIHYLFEEDK